MFANQLWWTVSAAVKHTIESSLRSCHGHGWLFAIWYFSQRCFPSHIGISNVFNISITQMRFSISTPNEKKNRNLIRWVDFRHIPPFMLRVSLVYSIHCIHLLSKSKSVYSSQWNHISAFFNLSLGLLSQMLLYQWPLQFIKSKFNAQNCGLNMRWPETAESWIPNWHLDHVGNPLNFRNYAPLRQKPLLCRVSYRLLTLAKCIGPNKRAYLLLPRKIPFIHLLGRWLVYFCLHMHTHG